MDVLEISMMIHDANKHLRSLFGDKYDEQAEYCRNIIRKLMAKENVSTLVALTKILQKVQDKFGDGTQSQVHTLWFCAAAVDVINEQAKS